MLEGRQDSGSSAQEAADNCLTPEQQARKMKRSASMACVMAVQCRRQASREPARRVRQRQLATMDPLHERVETLKAENESLKVHLAQVKQQGGILHQQLIHSKVQQVSSQAPKVA